QLLRDRKVLEHGQIEVVDARRPQDVATGTAKDARRRLRKGALVEPRGDGSSGPAVRVADEVRPVGPEGVEEAAGVSRRDRDRESFLDRGDPVHLPAANNRVRRFVEVGAVALAAPEGQVINEAGYQAMIDVEVRQPPITLRIVIV